MFYFKVFVLCILLSTIAHSYKIHNKNNDHDLKVQEENRNNDLSTPKKYCNKSNNKEVTTKSNEKSISDLENNFLNAINKKKPADILKFTNTLDKINKLMNKVSSDDVNDIATTAPHKINANEHSRKNDDEVKNSLEKITNKQEITTENKEIIDKEENTAESENIIDKEEKTAEFEENIEHYVKELTTIIPELHEYAWESKESVSGRNDADIKTSSKPNNMEGVVSINNNNQFEKYNKENNKMPPCLKLILNYIYENMNYCFSTIFDDLEDKLMHSSMSKQCPF